MLSMMRQRNFVFGFLIGIVIGLIILMWPSASAHASSRQPYSRYLIYEDTNHSGIAVLYGDASARAIDYYTQMCGGSDDVVTYDSDTYGNNSSTAYPTGRLIITCVGSSDY